MASEVDICNQALAMLGDKANVVSIRPPDRTVQAEHCARFYPLALGAMLEAHDWSFARSRAALALRSVSADNRAYTYAFPSNCLVPRAVFPLDSEPGENDARFEAELLATDRVLVTPLAGAQLLYTRGDVDPTKFTPLFREALALSLASRLAGPLVQGAEGRKAAMDLLAQFTRHALPDAISADSARRLGGQDHVPVWIGDR